MSENVTNLQKQIRVSIGMTAFNFYRTKHTIYENFYCTSLSENFSIFAHENTLSEIIYRNSIKMKTLHARRTTLTQLLYLKTCDK